MALKKARNRSAKVDQEVGIYLPLLNSRQKNVILSMLRVMAAKQVRLWDQLHTDQKRVLKKNKVNPEKNVTSTQVPGVNMSQVLASSPRMVKEGAAKPKK